MGKDRREMVRIVAEDYLHKHPGRPGRQKLRELASMIVGQYPASFKLTEPFGNKPFAKDGSETLFRQLEHRIENMKRPQSSLKRQAGGENSTKKRPRNSDRYGCVAWDPIIEGAVCREDLLSKRDELKRAFQTQDLQESSVRKLMTETYPIQREILNDDDTTIAVVKDEWPFLFEVPHLFDHASKLLGFSVQNKLAQISADPEVELPVTPCILIRGDQQFKIAVDGLLVNDHITSPIVALSYVFSMFYVCNVQYPPEMAFTLEFMQRVFFGVNPERGSKAEKKGKKRHFIPPQVCKLVSQLKEFECKQKESEWAI
ncbi:zinc finger and BTB domain-containing protein 34 [Sarotherodon galilaeus]